jgi:dihydroorotase-like cyclic amidohydrolase
VKNAAIHAKITRPADGLAFKESSSMDCPICSAIAIAITKATGKPVRIVDIKTSEDGDIVEADYMIIEE